MTKTIKLNTLLMRTIIIYIKLNTSGCFQRSQIKLKLYFYQLYTQTKQSALQDALQLHVVHKVSTWNAHTFNITTLTVLHHDGQEAHNNLGAGPDEDLTFPTLLSIVDAFESICENVHAHHDACGHTHKKRLLALDPKAWTRRKLVSIITIDALQTTLEH